MKKRKNDRSRTGLGFVALTVFVLCGIITYGKIGLDAKRNALSNEITMYQEQLAELTEEQEGIEEYKAYANSDENYEAIARKRLGLVYPDEIVFEPDDE